MRKKIIFSVVASFIFLHCYAQDTTGIKKVIDQMFIAMKNSDTLLLKSCFTSNTVIQTIQSSSLGAVVKDASVQSFINSIGKQPVGALDEKIIYDKILVNKELASVWAPYKLYIKGQ